jgi:hypothetical protein
LKNHLIIILTPKLLSLCSITKELYISLQILGLKNILSLYHLDNPNISRWYSVNYKGLVQYERQEILVLSYSQTKHFVQFQIKWHKKNPMTKHKYNSFLKVWLDMSEGFTISTNSFWKWLNCCFQTWIKVNFVWRYLKFQ